MLPVKITHMIIVPLFAQKSIRRYGEDEKGSKKSTKYEEEVIRKLGGREQRIEERFREGLRQLLSCSSILTTISLHCIAIRHLYNSKYLLII